MRYDLITAHRSMVFDRVRNDAYARALKAVVGPQSVVLDLGAGLGIHGLSAARLGAKKVYLVDPSSAVRVAEEIARGNGMEDRVQCFQGAIEDVSLPEPVDVIVSVMAGHFLLSEDLLPFLFYARDRYLKPGGVLLPSAGRMVAAAVSAPQLHHKYIECWSQPSQGLDFTAVRPFSANSAFPVNGNQRDARLISRPEIVTELDFMTAEKAFCRSEVVLGCSDGGVLHGFFGWFDIQLGDAWLSTAPQAPSTHWSQLYLPVDPPVSVAEGDIIRLKVIRPQDGNWTWEYEVNGQRVRRSTFLATPLNPGEIKQKA